MKLDLELIEKTFALMEKYLIDEVACEEFTIKKSKFKGQEKPPPDESELLNKHLQQTPTEPWDDIPSGLVDEWARTGKV